MHGVRGAWPTRAASAHRDECKNFHPRPHALSALDDSGHPRILLELHTSSPSIKLFLEQVVERRLGSQKFRRILRDVGPGLWLEVIAKIRLILFAHLLCCRLLAMFCVRRVVLHAHLADVQLSVARLADIQTTERQAKRGQRCAAAPAD
jgi:hypothetical protein